MPDTEPNCASCDTNSVPSSGFIGSWFLSCVVISVRKSSMPRLLADFFVCAADKRGLRLRGESGDGIGGGHAFQTFRVDGYGCGLTADCVLSCGSSFSALAVAVAASCQPDHHCPSLSVASIISFAVFMTSTLFWYERDAEIMSTISSTVFTFGA